MNIKFTQKKLEPLTNVSTSLTAKCEETESGFRMPLSIAVPNGAEPIPVAAIECELLDCEDGVLRLAVKSAQYSAGEAGDSTLLNHVLVDLKQVFPASNEGEINLVLPPPTAKLKSAPPANS